MNAGWIPWCRRGRRRQAGTRGAAEGAGHREPRIPCACDDPTGRAIADVGRIRLHATDATTSPATSGATNAFVIRPADLVVTEVPNAAGVLNPGGQVPTGPLFSGEAGLELSAPNARGHFDIVVDLGAAGLPWLRWDWPFDGNLDGIPDDDPEARATFGIFRGRQTLIHVRETY